MRTMNIFLMKGLIIPLTNRTRFPTNGASLSQTNKKTELVVSENKDTLQMQFLFHYSSFQFRKQTLKTNFVISCRD